MAYSMMLVRRRTDAERKGHWPSVHGESAYKIPTGIRAKFVKRKDIPFPDDYEPDPSEGEVARWNMVTPQDMSVAKARELLWATFHRDMGCGHSYDCCGCSNQSIAGVRKIARRRFSFVLSRTYNY